MNKPIPTFVLKTPPAIEPIGLDEVKAHSRIDLDDDDLLIQSQILAVRSVCEIKYNLLFITQTWTMYLNCLPDCIEINRFPVQSVTNVKYTDGDGSTQTLDANSYYADLNARPPRIVRAQEAAWPYVQPRPSAVAVEFIAGFGDKREHVPPHLLTGLLYKTADLYEHRESYSELKLQPLDFVDNLFYNDRLFSSV